MAGTASRWTFHFTPTSASWLNAVEGFFAKLARRRLKRGVFGSMVELQAAINRFLAEANDDPKPFVWTARPEHILEKVRRGNQALDADPLGLLEVSAEGMWVVSAGASQNGSSRTGLTKSARTEAAKGSS